MYGDWMGDVGAIFHYQMVLDQLCVILNQATLVVLNMVIVEILMNTVVLQALIIEKVKICL